MCVLRKKERAENKYEREGRERKEGKLFEG